jgi:hypothetical protein
MALQFHRVALRSPRSDQRRARRHCLAAVRASGPSFATAAVEKIVRRGPSVTDADLTASRCLSLKPLVDPRHDLDRTEPPSGVSPPDGFALGPDLGVWGVRQSDVTGWPRRCNETRGLSLTSPPRVNCGTVARLGLGHRRDETVVCAAATAPRRYSFKASAQAEFKEQPNCERG